MAIRMTGLNSGLDTESIIKELVSAKSIKIIQKKQRLSTNGNRMHGKH